MKPFSDWHTLTEGQFLMTFVPITSTATLNGFLRCAKSMNLEKYFVENLIVLKTDILNETRESDCTKNSKI